MNFLIRINSQIDNTNIPLQLLKCRLIFTSKIEVIMWELTIWYKYKGSLIDCEIHASDNRKQLIVYAFLSFILHVFNIATFF